MTVTRRLLMQFVPGLLASRVVGDKTLHPITNSAASVPVGFSGPLQGSANPGIADAVAAYREHDVRRAAWMDMRRRSYTAGIPPHIACLRSVSESRKVQMIVEHDERIEREADGVKEKLARQFGIDPKVLWG